MLNVLANTRIFRSLTPTDMRKRFDGLQGLVTNFLQRDPLSGHLLLSINRRRDSLKVLYWDGDGLAIWYRRLEQVTIQVPQPNDDDASLEMRSDELTMLLRRIDFTHVRRSPGGGRQVARDLANT